MAGIEEPSKGLAAAARMACEQAILSYLPGSLSAFGGAEDLLAAAERLYGRTLQELGVLVGPRGAQAVARRAIQLASTQHPCLGRLQPAEHGLPMHGFGRTVEELGCETALGCLTALYHVLVAVAASLLGEDLLTKLLARVTQAANE